MNVCQWSDGPPFVCRVCGTVRNTPNLIRRCVSDSLDQGTLDGLDCVHCGTETSLAVQCGRCPGSQTAVYTCDLLGEYCLPLGSKSVRGFTACRGCSGFAAASRQEAENAER